MESKRYDNVKKFIARAMGSILVAFICISGFGFRNVEKYTIHADTYTPVQKQSFVTWLLSYFGINIYTDAQQISDDLYTAVKLAYDAYLATLQPQQQVTFDDILDGVTWDNAKPNTLKLTGYIFNALKGFSDYISSQVYDPTDVDGLQIGTFEIINEGTYLKPLPNTCFETADYTYNGDRKYCYSIIKSDNNDVRVVQIINSGSSSYCDIFYVSLNPFVVGWGESYDKNFNPNLNNTYNAQTYSFNGITYYIRNNTLYSYSGYSNWDTSFIPTIPLVSGLNARKEQAIKYTFGVNSSSPDVTLNDVYALPQQGILDDLIGAADPESDVELDLDGSDIAYSTAATLADIIGMINDAVNGYVLDDSYPDTAAKIAAQSQAIENELIDVDYPNASSWEVPQTISTPQIIPLIQPDCPDLSACLVAGIQDVGSSLGNVIDANSNVSNYVSVILFMGIALTILGGI